MQKQHNGRIPSSGVGKDYIVQFEERSHYVYAHVTAPSITTDIALGYLFESVQYCEQNGFERLLIYREIPNMLSDVDVYIVSTELLKFAGSIIMAVVNPFTEENDSLMFARNVTTNRGALHEVFATVEDAEKWLLRDIL